MQIKTSILKDIINECHLFDEQKRELQKVVDGLEGGKYMTSAHRNGRIMNDVRVYSYQTDTSWGPSFVECSNITELFYFIANLVINHNAIVTSVNEICRDGSRPRIGFRGDPDFKMIVKNLKAENKRKHDAAVAYLKKEAGKSKFYEIVEDSHEYDNGLLLIVYLDEKYEHEDWHICVNVDEF